MKDENKTKKELIEEVKGLRRKVLRLENSESGNIPGNEVFRKRTHELSERVKELNCLYKLSVAINKPGISVDEMIRETVELIQPAMQYPEAAAVRAVLEEKEFKTRNFKETKWSLVSDIVVRGEQKGFLEVYYLEEKPELDEGQFLKEEKILIDSVAGRLGSAIGSKRIAEELNYERYYLQTLMDNIPDHVFFKDDISRFIKVNRAMSDVLRAINDTQLEGKTDHDYFTDTFAEETFMDEIEIMRTRKPLINKEEKVVFIDGSEKWCSVTKMPLIDKTGKIIGTFGISRDITSFKLGEEELRKARDELELRIKERTSDLMKTNEQLKMEINERGKADMALKKSEENYRNLVENLPDIVFAVDEKGSLTYVSPAVKPITGYTPEEAMNLLFSTVVHPEDFDSGPEDSRKTMADGRFMNEIRIFTKSGETRWLRISRLPVYSGDRIIGYEGIATDITQSKLLQERLIRSERLAATGQLAASVAHEINSPLQAITVMLNTISEIHVEDKALNKNIEILKKAFGSIRDTVRNLMDLNRPGMEPKHPLNINEIIEKTSALVKTHLKQSRIDITMDLSPKVPNIVGSPQGLGHVFLNLINNAVEVMSGVLKGNEKWMTRAAAGGIIFIKSRFDKDHIDIEVADTGPGIPEEELNRIFDPFYTKKKTMGMGVGLSICNGIIEDHGGSIEAKNIPDGGALFTITLPVK